MGQSLVVHAWLEANTNFLQYTTALMARKPKLEQSNRECKPIA